MDEKVGKVRTMLQENAKKVLWKNVIMLLCQNLIAFQHLVF